MIQLQELKNAPLIKLTSQRGSNQRQSNRRLDVLQHRHDFKFVEQRRRPRDRSFGFSGSVVYVRFLASLIGSPLPTIERFRVLIRIVLSNQLLSLAGLALIISSIGSGLPASTAQNPADPGPGGTERATGTTGQSQTMGRTYFVDASKGDDRHSSEQAQQSATAWKTLQRAARAASPGDTVAIAAGLYRETLTPVRSGTPDAPITFRAADPSQQPVIRGSDPVGDEGWQRQRITTFDGREVDAWTNRIQTDAKLVYDRDGRMLPAQHPNQSDPDDPYQLSRFLEVPDQRPSNRLSDLATLGSLPRDYFVGAELLVHDSGSRTVRAAEIISSSLDGSVTVDGSKLDNIGNREEQRLDRYSLRGHVGVLDHAREFCVRPVDGEYELYVVAGDDRPSDLEISARASGIEVSDHQYLIFDGINVENCGGNAINLQGRSITDVAVLNCDVQRNERSGLKARFVERLTVKNLRTSRNLNNGLSLMDVSAVKLHDCESFLNGNNGLWIGGGTRDMFNSRDISIKQCHFHDNRSNRSHPDNLQMHQVDNVRIDSCLFEQDGNQNMWLQYTDRLSITNSIFSGGSLGINSARHAMIAHNLLLGSKLRFDRHLDNHRVHGAAFMPKKVTIANNVIIDSSIRWPGDNDLDRFDVFDIRNNFYAIDSKSVQDFWRWNGEQLMFDKNSMAVTDKSYQATSSIVEYEVANRFANPAGLVFCYQDPDNYYWIDLGRDGGIRRLVEGRTLGITEIASGQPLHLPRSADAAARFTLFIATSGESTIYTVTMRRGDKTSSHLFTEASGAVGGGVGVVTFDGKNRWTTLQSLVIRTADGTDAVRVGRTVPGAPRGASEIAVNTVTGSMRPGNLDGSGIGWGPDSIVASRQELGTVFANPTSRWGPQSDFRPLAGGPLPGAGRPLGLTSDYQQQTRPIVGPPTIGPYEMPVR